jgi:hypothetical protein
MMRVGAFRRLLGWILLGLAIASGVLAIRAYPGERTWVDKAELAYSNWAEEHDRGHRTLRRDCQWRVLFCDEFPSAIGPLVGVADTVIARVQTVSCLADYGWERWESDRAGSLICYLRQPDTSLGFVFGPGDTLRQIVRTWRHETLVAEFDRIRALIAARRGVPTMCPPQTDSSPSLHIDWSLGEITLSLSRNSYDGITQAWSLEPIRCWSHEEYGPR